MNNDSRQASEYTPARVSWNEDDAECSALWMSANGVAPPKRVVIAKDELTADSAYRLICEGTAILWRGDFHNARQLLQALARRIDKPPKPKGSRKKKVDTSQPEAATLPATSNAKAAGATIPLDPNIFHQHRMHEAQRARLLGLLLVPHEADHGVALRRAPDVREACVEARGNAAGPYVASLRELQGIIGAHEWRRVGVEIPLIEARIHPHYGVYSPVRGEYLDLINAMPMPPALQGDAKAFDIGTGTGVIAALLAKRGVARIIATDNDERALACARDNVAQLELQKKISIGHADLFPEGRAALIVCNPPWIPGKAATLLERTVYDPESRMLRGFLSGLGAHLVAGGEGWLILSDIAEHLGLRTRGELLGWIEAAKLVVLERRDIKPRHSRAADASDPLFAARSRETTSLWRLGIK